MTDNQSPHEQDQLLLEQHLRIFAAFSEHTIAYTKAIVAIGYAGLFGAWSFTKQLLPPDKAALAGLSALISLAVFILWEIYSSVSMLRRYRAMAAGVAPDQEAALKGVREYYTRETRIKAQEAALHCGALLVTLVTGVLAGGIIFWYNLKVLWDGWRPA